MIKKSYCIQNNNMNSLLKSTSGGFFDVISKWCISNNGYVFGACYDKDFNVVHSSSNNDSGIFYGSKYVQSNLKNVFIEVLQKLKDEKLVVFSGTPCQISALKLFLNNDYENLITVEVICHGVSSPLLFDKYKSYMEKKYKSKITKIIFRSKQYGYKIGTMYIEFQNGKCSKKSARTDLMLKSFFSEISSRPICYQCPFKGKNREADFSIFDCWNISKIVHGINYDDFGWTNVFINSDKGISTFDKLCLNNNFKFYEADPDVVIRHDGLMVFNQPLAHQNRKEFYETLNKIGIEKTIRKFVPISLKDRLIDYLKRFRIVRKIILERKK